MTIPTAARVEMSAHRDPTVKAAAVYKPQTSVHKLSRSAAIKVAHVHAIMARMAKTTVCAMVVHAGSSVLGIRTAQAVNAVLIVLEALVPLKMISTRALIRIASDRSLL
jgi:hypothetical protein